MIYERLARHPDRIVHILVASGVMAVVISETYLMLYLSLVRQLLDELNANSAAGLITHKALPLISLLDQHTRKIERIMTNAQTDPTPQQ